MKSGIKGKLGFLFSYPSVDGDTDSWLAEMVEIAERGLALIYSGNGGVYDIFDSLINSL